jgi:hypothetical protein
VERSFYAERNEARWGAQYHSDKQIVPESKTGCAHVVVQRKRRPSSADDAIKTATLLTKRSELDWLGAFRIPCSNLGVSLDVTWEYQFSALAHCNVLVPRVHVSTIVSCSFTPLTKDSHFELDLT